MTPGMAIQFISNLSDIDFGAGFEIAQFAMYEYHGCVLSVQDELKCFGRNSNGQLGYGDTENRGDDDEEMGDWLPVISLPFTANPTTEPTSDPTMPKSSNTIELATRG